MIDDVFQFSGVTTRELKTLIIAACGGFFNDAYFKLLETDLNQLSDDLEIWREYQIEKIESEKRVMNSQSNKSEVLIPGNM